MTDICTRSEKSDTADYDTKFHHVYGVQNIRKAFWYIEKGLYSVAEEAGADWIPADIYHKLVTEQAMLLMAYEGNESYIGFCIVSQDKAENGETELFVEAVFSEVPELGFDVFRGGDHFLSVLARDMSAKRIIFASSRKGWVKRLAPLGYTVQQYTYVKEL